MLTGFEKIVEERIKKAQRDGQLDDLPGRGEPLVLQEDRHIPEDLRMCYKILKNADCTPPEIELRHEIVRTEELLQDMVDTAEKYRVLKKLNFLVLKLNSMRKTSINFELPQHYELKLAERFGDNK